MNAPYHLSLIIPVYNEEAVLHAVLQHNAQLLSALPYEAEIVLVNDASTDHSEQVIKQFIADYKGGVAVHYVCNKNNEGFGGAVSKGIATATGVNILCLPADVYITDTQLNNILASLLVYEAVACYRTEKPGNSFVSKVGSFLYQFLAKLAFGLRVRDLNWIHAYQRKIFIEGGIVPRNKGFFFLAEMLIKIKWKGYQTGELLLNPQERTNRKGVSQRFSSFSRAMKDALMFWLKAISNGKRVDD